MHSVELLAEAVDAARRIGFEVREEWFGGSGGGACRIHERKCLFLDLSLTPRERLEQALDALDGDPAVKTIELPPPLRRLLAVRRVA